MYSTDNGPHMNTWPDGAMTPFRSEKDTQALVAKFLETFKDFPPRQRAASFTIDQAMQKAGGPPQRRRALRPRNL